MMRAEESTPEKAWNTHGEQDGRQSRSKSRTKVTNNLISVAGIQGAEGSDKKRNIPTNVSANQYPPQTGTSGRPKPVKSTAVRHKQPSSNVPGRLFSGQPARKQNQGPTDYNALHEELITEILKEEEEVLGQHKDHIDAMYKSTKIVV
jgi:hypothetical protein